MSTTQTDVQNTREMIRSMLTENTGRHFLDSGGAYGRNWEQNQERDFDNEPDVTADWRHGWLDVTLSTYHFLVEALEYEPELDKAFQDWCEEPQNEREPWLPLMEEFADLIRSSDEHPAVVRFRAQIGPNPWTGEDIDGSLWTVNTYNHESLVEQVLQYTLLGNLTFLQVHGGCDVRGGYTRPRIFRAFEDAFPSLLDDARATIRCDRCHERDSWSAFWETDDGYHWYFDGGTGNTELQEYPAEDIDEPEGYAAWVARHIVLEVLEEHDEATDLLPIRAYSTDGNYSLCPLCYEGRLEASC